MPYSTIEERLKFLTQKGTLSLAIEGRFTNLFIWLSDDLVYMRIDKANQYSVPLNVKHAAYLHRNKKIIEPLLKYGFESSATNVHDILEITKKMPYRMPVEW